MKILMLTHALYRTGTWYRVFNLASVLVRRGHTVSIVKLGLQRMAPRETIEDGVSVLEIPRLWGSSWFHQGTRMPHDIAGRFGWHLLKDFDVVHGFTHHLNSLLPTLLVRWATPKTIVLGDRDDLWAEGGLLGAPRKSVWLERLDHGFHRWTEYNMARWLGTMTVVSDDLLQRVLETGVDPRRVRKIINGCPINRIAPGDRDGARAKLGLPRDRQIALFVGVGQYDVDMILDALMHLRGQRRPEQMPLTVLVGPHEDSMKKWAADRGLSDDVVTTGFLSDAAVLPYLQAADIGLLPFADKPLNRARFPIKIGDYLAAGLPVLTNDVGEMGRIVREEDVGEVTASDPLRYAEGLRCMLDDGDRLAAWRLRARAAAEQMSWEAVGGELERFYLELIPA